ncbi:MAG: ChbG/HpnK family deacetylase [Ruminococcaceae bacterium]|nr:ChbG/HpnK family deacetylase [Oscillospiraceae bacterium]
MAKILVRADDLGYSEAFNYGLARAVKSGIVRSVGVMPNMEWAEHGVRLMDGTDVTFTVHANICQGKPITDPKLIPSLVDENGEFKHKDLYRNAKEDFVVLEEVVMEVEAQFNRLVELTGKKPYMVEAHAVPSANFNKALAIVAQKYGVESMKVGPKGPMIGSTYLKFSMDSGNPDYNPFESFKKAASQPMAEDEAALMVLHPGFVDAYVLDTSYITTARAREVEFAINPEVPKWCRENGVQLLTYADL